MRITLAMPSTGLAYFPGLAKPITIDTRNLPEEQASELERLVREVGTFDEPMASAGKGQASEYSPTHFEEYSSSGEGSSSYSDSRGHVPSRGADLQQYVFNIQEGKRRVMVNLTEPIRDPNVARLIDYLQGLAHQERNQTSRPKQSKKGSKGSARD